MAKDKRETTETAELRRRAEELLRTKTAQARPPRISAAGDDEWEDLKTGTEQIWGDFTTMLGKAIKKIK